MEVPDRELLAWVTGEAAVPADHDTALFRRLRDFNHRREAYEIGMARSSRRTPGSRPPAHARGRRGRRRGLVVSDLARAVAARADAPATSLVVVCRDGPRMAALARALGFFAPIWSSSSFRPGTACPMTGSRRMPASSPNA